MKLTIIGCGRLGKTLAYLWKKNKLVKIQDIYNTRVASAENALSFIGEGTACQSIKQFKSADIYLLATPDDQIERLCQQLAEQAPPKVGSLVMHCSGVHASDSLSAVKSLGCFTASVHPNYAFSNPAIDVHHFSGTHCSFEGDSEALERISPLIEKIGGQVFSIDKKHKALYHAASVFASNYLVTLSSVAEDCYKKSGVPDSLAKVLVNILMQQSLNLIKGSHISSKPLTGPIQRGDKESLKKHLKALRSYTNLEQLYKTLGKNTLVLTEHSFNLKKDLDALLGSRSKQ